MNNKIVQFPIKSYERERNHRGKRTVSCIVENRYLAFDLAGPEMVLGTPVYLQVVSENLDAGTSRDICTLFVTLEQLEKVVDVLRSEIKKE